ncbi:MAG: hypothetical protein DSY95_04090 [SAR324 cluster bacterium]|uniref:Glycoside hydrolase family 9 domain-containing protein n=1 Tax=SAR324 cluster bacterium TaxID=2024889 RepID=A0A432GRA9_9DELT|nr:MAG: hypothetical protein DSY95_04090 [SAR324 cluster bacterium]
MLWGVLRWPNAYREAGQMDNVLDTVRWPLEYFLKCWNPQEQELYVQVSESCTEQRSRGRKGR